MSRLLGEKIQREVLRLKGTKSNRAIGRILGIARGTVIEIIKRGYVKSSAGNQHTETIDDLVYTTSGEMGRCPTCGAKAILPCWECIIREWKKKHTMKANQS
jgi:hypothetical protein